SKSPELTGSKPIETSNCASPKNGQLSVSIKRFKKKETCNCTSLRENLFRKIFIPPKQLPCFSILLPHRLLRQTPRRCCFLQSKKLFLLLRLQSLARDRSTH